MNDLIKTATEFLLHEDSKSKESTLSEASTKDFSEKVLNSIYDDLINGDRFDARGFIVALQNVMAAFKRDRETFQAMYEVMDAFADYAKINKGFNELINSKNPDLDYEMIKKAKKLSQEAVGVFHIK
jgi:hypothetical protein